MLDPQKIGSRVAARRKVKKLSRERLASHAGVTTSCVWNLEHGRNSTLKTLDAIARALGTTAADLIRGA